MQDKNFTTRQPLARQTFVEPGPPEPRVTVLPPTELPMAPIVPPMPHSSYRDKAHGFVLVTAPLAAATGFVVLLIAISAFGVPVLSVLALLVALGGFTFAWLVAYIAHTLISADGALFLYVVLVFRLLAIEARERRKRYGKH